MPRIKITSETQIDFPEISIRGKAISVAIDDRPDGNLIYWDENFNTRALSCEQLNILFNDQILLTTYDDVLADSELNIITRLTNNIQTGPDDTIAWEAFYNNSGEYGVGLAKFMINNTMKDVFDVRCFKIDGTYIQPITFDTTVTDETAVYPNYYSQRQLDNDPGLSNDADTPNQDGTVQLDVVDGSGPFTYTLLKAEAGTSGNSGQSENLFENLSGANYITEITGNNGSLGQPGIEVIALSTTQLSAPLLLDMNSDVISNSTGNLLIVNSVQNSVGAVEYKLDNSDWTESNTFRDVVVDTLHILQVRDSSGKAATKNCFL